MYCIFAARKYNILDNDKLKIERQALKEASKKRREDQKTELLPILTAEQKQKLTEIESKRKEKHNGKHDHKRKNHEGKEHKKKADLSPEQVAERKVNRLAKQLELTPEQKQQVKEVHLKHINDNKRSKEQRQEASKEHKRVKEEIKLLKNSHAQKVEKILTPEQLIKYNELKAAKQNKRNAKTK